MPSHNQIPTLFLGFLNLNLPPHIQAMAATPTPHGSLFIVYSLVVLYALCYQLQSPIEPFLVDKLLNSTGKGAATASESAVA